ncbi:MAG TPA: multidrug effflux MFS transporter [Parachlamydiaceae bacterium]|nr:multidrug effflux MFS transporter [Parachlamydiaceae bacterium]
MKLAKYFPYLLIFSAISADIEIELSLPSFPDIARAFNVSPEVIEGTISLNFLGFCIAALFYGPLSDRFGRRPVFIWGTVLYLIGSLSCSFAMSIEMLLVSRFIQGLGAAGSFVLVFIMLSDVYKGKAALHWMGLMNTILTATLALAPILGGYLNLYFGWSSCYTFISLMTITQLSLLFFFLPETREGQILSVKEVVKDYNQFFFSSRFIQSSLVPSLLCAGYTAFVSVIPFLYRDKLGMSLSEFSYHQAALITSFALTSYYANRIAQYFGDIKSAKVGSSLSMIATLALLILCYFENSPTVWLITPLMCVFSGSCAIPFNILFTESLSIIPEKNATASSLLLSMRMLICALAIQLAGFLYNDSLFSTVVIVFSCSLISLCLLLGFYHGKKSIDQSLLQAALD